MINRVKYFFLILFPCVFARCQTTNNEQIEAHSENISVAEKAIVDTNYYCFAWKDNYLYDKVIVNNIEVPKGYQRMKLEKNSFGDWLRHLPLKDNNTVYLYDGEEKLYQHAQYRVIDIDVGDKDLQQCADAVMRLRAEYHFSMKQFDKIHFNYTNGTNIPFPKWSSGYYPSLKGNKVVWVTRSGNDSSYLSFKKYMTNIFMYAGTASLEKELNSTDLKNIKPGDVLIKGGFPGHAVLVVDVAVNEKTGDKIFMIVQSYMPAQDIHLLHNFENEGISPWYSISECKEQVRTPEWTFDASSLKRFKE